MQRYFRISHSLEILEFEVYLCQCFPAIDRNHWQLHLGSRSEWSTIHISSITLELSLSTTFFSQFPSHGTWLGGVQVVLELCSDGTVVTSDQPPTVLGSLPSDFLQQVLPQHCVFADSIYYCSHVLTHLIRENLRLEYCCSFFANLFHWSPVAQWLCRMQCLNLMSSLGAGCRMHSTLSLGISCVLLLGTKELASWMANLWWLTSIFKVWPVRIVQVVQIVAPR